MIQLVGDFGDTKAYMLHYCKNAILRQVFYTFDIGYATDICLNDIVYYKVQHQLLPKNQHHMFNTNINYLVKIDITYSMSVLN